MSTSLSGIKKPFLSVFLSSRMGWGGISTEKLRATSRRDRWVRIWCASCTSPSLGSTGTVGRISSRAAPGRRSGSTAGGGPAGAGRRHNPDSRDHYRRSGIFRARWRQPCIFLLPGWTHPANHPRSLPGLAITGAGADHRKRSLGASPTQRSLPSDWAGRPIRTRHQHTAFSPPGFLMMCSDGLWGVVPEQEIFRIIHAAPTPAVACQQLIDAANDAGGPDNITVILVYYPN